jgi:hypothetical protein
MLYQHGNQKDGVTELLILYSYTICFRFLQFSEIFIFCPLLFHRSDSELHNGGESRMRRGKRVPFQGDKGTCHFTYFQIYVIFLLSFKRE